MREAGAALMLLLPLLDQAKNEEPGGLSENIIQSTREDTSSSIGRRIILTVHKSYILCKYLINSLILLMCC